MAYYLLTKYVIAFLVFLNERNGIQLIKLNTRLILRSNLSIGSSIRSNTTGVECTESKLSTRLTNSLSRNHTYSLTKLYHTSSSQVTAVTLHADTLLALTSKYRTDFYTLDRRLIDSLSLGLRDFLTSLNNQLTGSWVNNIMYRYTTQDTLIERRNNLITILQCSAYQATQSTTVLLSNDYIMRNVNKTTSQISGVGSLHSGIGKTLTSTVRSNKVLQHRHTLLKVRKDRVLNDLRTFSTRLLRLSHQTTHTRQLLNLILRTTSSRIKHHVHSIESLVSFSHFLHQDVTQVCINVSPRINNLVVTLLVGDETHIIVIGDFLNLLTTTLYDSFLLWWDNDITKVERKTSNISHTITEVLNTIEEFASLCHTNSLDYIRDKSAQCLLRDNIVEETYLFWYNLVDDNTTYRSFNHTLLEFTINEIIDNHLNRSVEVTSALITSNQSLLWTIERQAFTLSTWANLSNIVKTKHHILRRNGDRRTISRVQDVMALKHQHLSLQYSFIA